MRKIAIIGSGFSSLSAACFLSSKGHEVSVFEKEGVIGGRARKKEINGFTFDMWPTFFCMSDIFDRFFDRFNVKTLDYFNFERLHPSYQIYFANSNSISLPCSKEQLLNALEENGKGNSKFSDLLINDADVNLQTLYVKGGMYKIIESIERLAESFGTTFFANSMVEEIVVDQKSAKGIIVNGDYIEFDLILSGIDYQSTESLLNNRYRNYYNQDNYRLSYSALLFYVGFDKKIKNVSHNTIFLDTDFDFHAENIYDLPEWPENPMFYASFPSITDNTIAPKGKETGIFLIPIALGLDDNDAIKNVYFEKIISRMEKMTDQKLRDNIEFFESYYVNNLSSDYFSSKEDAIELANTIAQSSSNKANIKNKKIRNLFYIDGLTIPDLGISSSMISGEIVAEEALKSISK